MGPPFTIHPRENLKPDIFMSSYEFPKTGFPPFFYLLFFFPCQTEGDLSVFI